MNRRFRESTELELQFLIKQLFAAYPAAGSSPEQLITYAEDLAELELIALKEALKNLRRSSTFLPTIAEIYEETRKVTNQNAQRKESATRKLLESSTVKVAETEVSRMLFAINHNIRERKAKELPLLEPLRLARLQRDIEGVALITDELRSIREYHEALANIILSEFSQGKQITYLKEIMPDFEQKPLRNRGQGWSRASDLSLNISDFAQV